MADTIARREARRRRILENSENRLKKIVGHKDGEEKKSMEEIFDAPKVESKTTSTEINQLFNGVGKTENEDYHLSTNDQNISTNTVGHDSVNHMIFNAFNNQDINSMWNEEAVNNALSFLNSVNNTDQQNNISGNSNELNNAVPINILSKSIFLYKILISRMSFIWLAIIVNILCIYRMEYLFGKAIIVPCFTMILARIYFYQQLPINQSSSLLMAALVLCQVKPHIVYTIKILSTFSNIIINDLAIYIFCYTIIYYFIHYFKIISNE